MDQVKLWMDKIIDLNFYKMIVSIKYNFRAIWKKQRPDLYQISIWHGISTCFKFE